MKAIVIGAGPSIKTNNHLSRIRDSHFGGYLLISDSMLRPTLENGITPDKFKMIVCTLEDMLPNELNPCFEGEFCKKYAGQIKIVHAIRTRPQVLEFLRSYGYQLELNTDPEINISANVGLMCCKYASSFCDKIALVGVDHAFSEDFIPPAKNYKEVYDLCYQEVTNPHTGQKLILTPLFINWRIEFMEMIQATKSRIFNCTGGGSIFGDKITYCELEEFINGYN